MNFPNHKNTFTVKPRSLVLSSVSLMLLISLISSTSIQYGHADVPIAATADAIRPLVEGDSAPRFTVRTVDGDRFDFDPRELKQPAIIISFRGGWCPFCNMHLSELRNVIPEIHALGVDVLFLSGDRPEMLYSSLAEDTQEDIVDLGYTIYSDADANAAIAFGIAFQVADRTINRRMEKGQDVEGSSMVKKGVLPVPSVFAVNRDGVIAFAYSSADYKIRVPANELLAVAKMIASGAP
jgi:peroxiredoxin